MNRQCNMYEYHPIFTLVFFFFLVFLYHFGLIHEITSTKFQVTNSATILKCEIVKMKL